MTSQPISLFNPWESEAMHSYRCFAASSPPAPPSSTASVLFATENTSSPQTLVPEQNSATILTQDAPDDDWVMVKNEEVEAAKQAENSQTVAKKVIGSSGPVRVTRELSDTAFRKAFQKPVVHAFGRGNTKPVVDWNMLKTHNVRAAETSRNAVYPSALRALDEIRKGNNKKRSNLSRKKNTRRSTRKSAAPTRKDCTKQEPVLISCEGCCGTSNPDGILPQEVCVPVKQDDPSMFELLRWDKSLAGMGSSAARKASVSTNTMQPAGITSKKSEPVANLLQWSM